MGFLLLIGVLLFRPSPLTGLVAVFGIGWLLGWWRYDAAISSRALYALAPWYGKTVEAAGRVASDPDVSGSRQSFTFTPEFINDQPVGGRVLLRAWQFPLYHYGDQLRLKLSVAAPLASSDFNYAAYLAKDGISATANQAGDIEIMRPAPFSIMGALYNVKHWLAAKINQLLPEPDSALLQGLLLGQRSQLPEDLVSALKASGTTHIVALSGFNIAIVAGFFMWLLRPAPRRWALVLAGVGILAFVVMTGASSSVVRAAVMGWMLLLTTWWGRRRHSGNAVLVAALILTMINPLVLQYDVGFQLSLAATAGLIFISPLVDRRLPLQLPNVIRATLAATIATLPLIIFHFGGFSLVALLANLLVVPIVPLVMLLGFGAIVIFAVIPFLQIIGLVSWLATRLLLIIIQAAGSLPHAFVEVPPLPPVYPVVYYLLLIGIVHWLSRAKTTRS
ncbi:MAG: ComEC/Rec2 family competence protein [bacterium]